MGYTDLAFNKRKFATAKQMRFSAGAKGTKNSPVMKKLLQNKNVARILDKPAERKELYAALKEKASQGVSKNEFKEVLGHFRMGKGKTIDKSEAMKLAKEIGPKFGKRYIFEKETTKATVSNPSTSSPTRSSLINAFGRKNTSGNNPANSGNTQKYTRSFSNTQSARNIKSPGQSGSAVRPKLF